MCKFRNYDNYEVYEDGRIGSYRKNKFLKPQTNNKGYQLVGLVDNEGKKKSYLYSLLRERSLQSDGRKASGKAGLSGENGSGRNPCIPWALSGKTGNHGELEIDTICMRELIL